VAEWVMMPTGGNQRAVGMTTNEVHGVVHSTKQSSNAVKINGVLGVSVPMRCSRRWHAVRCVALRCSKDHSTECIAVWSGAERGEHKLG